MECGEFSPLLRRRLVAVGIGWHGNDWACSSLRQPDMPHQRETSRTSTATSRLQKAVTSPRTPQRMPWDGPFGRDFLLPLCVTFAHDS